MKRYSWIAALLVVALAFVLFGCGGEAPPEAGPGGKTLTFVENLYGNGFKLELTDILKGQEIKQGDTFVLKMKFTVNRDTVFYDPDNEVFQGDVGFDRDTKTGGVSIGLLSIAAQGHIPQDSPNGTNYFSPISWTPEDKLDLYQVYDDNDDLEESDMYATRELEAGREYKKSITLKALRDAGGDSPDQNVLYFQTIEFKKTTPGGQPQPGIPDPLIITCTEYSFVKN